jgi:hypothetical protein
MIMINRILLVGIWMTFLAGLLNAQISIDVDDMPDPGDTIRLSTTLVLDGIDYESTGEDFTWDFSNLTVMMQTVDSFKNVAETPLSYQLFFNNGIFYPEYKATVARALFSFDAIPGFEVEDAFQFYKESDDDYREVGIGVTLFGLAIPVTYDEIDIVYRFPVEYGNSDSSESSFLVSVPSLGAASSERFRRNYVDGWGTLITPYGSFETLRIKTLIYQKDSVYIDSTGTGIPVERDIIEYKWFGKEQGLPILTVTEEGLIVTASYIDTVRNNFFGTPEEKLSESSVVLYPNPTAGRVACHFKNSDGRQMLEIEVFDYAGRSFGTLFNVMMVDGTVAFDISHLPDGAYFLRLQSEKDVVVKKLVKQNGAK